MKARIRALVVGVAAALVLRGAGAFAQSSLGAPVPPPAVGPASGILVDLDNGKILWSHDDQTPRPPASLTKMITALLVLERTKPSEEVVITREARYAEGGRIYVEEGWTFSVEEMMWGLLLESGNDAAVALAQKASPDGTLEGFVRLMNERSKQIGALASSFTNPHGLDAPGHATTARDLALIATAAMRNESFAQIVTARTHQITWGDGSTRTFINGNKLLSRYAGAIGIKTGFTNEAGRALASAVRRDGTTLLAVVLDSPDHYQDSIVLYDWAFANLPVLQANPIGIIRPAQLKAAAHDPVRGLEVVQYDPGAERTPNDGSAILVVPLLVLGGAIVTGRWIRERMRSRPALEIDLH